MVLKYPKAKWEPLGAQTEARMRSHDILCFHTMVGTLAGTSSMFHKNGYGGTESHFGVGESVAQGIEQWQDLMYQADANLDGGHRVTSIETADYGGVFGKWNTNDASKVPAWTEDQLDMLVDLTVWWCRKETHENCPSSWACHKYGVPAVLIPDTKAGRRGLGYHQQGCDPVRVRDGEKWSSAYGKVCPGDRRIRQLKGIIIPRVQAALVGKPTNNTQEDPLSGITAKDIGAAVATSLQPSLDALATRLDGIEQKYVVADNKADAQVSVWQAVAQAEAAHLLAGGTPHTQEELVEVRDKIWSFMRPIWTPAT